MPNTALTDSVIAAIAEGAAAPAANSGKPQDPTTEAPGGGGSGDAATAAAAKAEAEKKAADEAAAKKAEAEAAQDAAGKALRAELGEALKREAKLAVEVDSLKASAEAAGKTMGALREIAVASVKRLRVAMGQSPAGAEVLNDEALLAEHAALRASFEQKFKSGGLAAVSADDTADKKPEGQVDDARRAARLAATRASTGK